ncbi:caspase family protein [Simulacricoccus sp. 17bor-14]|uniref:caspase family protein n=1 Tax=Myxococcaceae TaxID=31 RepID=UPI0018900071|nr:caspase family protein [Simulacricoccus sp. 17bor-14]
MPNLPLFVRPLLLSSLLLLCACASSAAREKGGLVRARVDASALQKAQRGERYALVIGIGHFEDGAWGNLRYAEKDAEDLARVLRDPQRGGFREVTVLTGEAATRERVRKALGDLEARPLREQDVVLIYVSSHGTLARDVRGELQRFLVTSDAQLAQVADTALETRELEDALGRLTSRRRVLVLATCHSGSGKSLLPAQVRAELERLKGPLPPPPLEEGSRASLVLSASDWSEAAREDDALANDVYTHFLVEALDGSGDRNLDGAVSATEAHDYARRRTYAYTQGRQRPSAHIQEVGADPVLLSGELTRPGQPELFSYGGRLEGFTLKVDGKAAGELPGGVSVPAGKREVELLKGGQRLWSGSLDLQPGERRELEGLLVAEARARTTLLVGGQALTSLGSTRQELLPGALMAGAGVWMPERLLDGRLDVWADAAAGGASHALSVPTGGSVPMRQRTISVGAAVGHTWYLGPVGLSTGPRLAALWMERGFTLPLYTEQEHYLTLAPGWLAAASLPVSRHLVLMLQGQVQWSFLPLDGQTRTVPMASAGLYGGYRF